MRKQAGILFTHTPEGEYTSIINLQSWQILSGNWQLKLCALTERKKLLKYL